MQIKSDTASLLLLARHRTADSDTLVVTVGLLYDVDQTIVKMELAQPWLLARFDKAPFDSGLKKSRGSFAVQGSAYPQGELQPQGMATRVRVGDLSKTLHIHPPRRWQKTLLGYKPVVIGPLTPLPLNAMNAFGGPDYADNLQGVGYRPAGQEYDGVPLPSIETERQSLTAPGDRPAWAGLMPLPTQSSSRRQYLGTMDEQWTRHRAPFLPLDTDPRWYDEVAQDQCKEGYWAGTESWSVAGMHPVSAEVTGRLPGFRPRLFVARRGNESPITEALLELDTVWLFPDVERVLLLYRDELAVADIDAEDILKLGVACERAADPRRSSADWVARLWPQAPASVVPEDPRPPEPDPTPGLLARLQASLDAAYKAFSIEQEEALAAGAAIAARHGQPFDAAAFRHTAPDLAQSAANAKAPVVFDPVALSGEIEAEIAQAQAAGQGYADKIAQRVGIDLPAMQARINLLQAEQPARPLASIVDRLSIPAGQKAEIRAQIEAGQKQAKETESQIDSKIAELEKELALMSSPAVADMVVPPVRIVWTRQLLAASHAGEEKLSGQRFRSLDLSRIDLSAGQIKNCTFDTCDLTAARLTGVDLSGCTFNDCDLSGADLQQATLNKTIFQRCRLEQATLSEARFATAYATQSGFAGADFKGADLEQTQFTECAFNDVNMDAANLNQASFQRCDLSGAHLVGARLSKSRFHACQLNHAQMRGADLQGASWSKTEGQAIELSAGNLRNWRLDQDCRLPGIRLDDADMSDASLQGAVLSAASLRGVTLNNALVSRCDLSDSDGYHLFAHGADFTGSDLSRARWVGANLLDARLRKVRLEQTDLRGSNLFGANTEGVRGAGVRLEDALLTRCRLREDLANV